MGSRACLWVVARDSAGGQLPWLSCAGPENISLGQKNALATQTPQDFGIVNLSVCISLWDSSSGEGDSPVTRQPEQQWQQHAASPFHAKSFVWFWSEPYAGDSDRYTESKQLGLPTGIYLQKNPEHVKQWEWNAVFLELCHSQLNTHYWQ